MKKLKFNLNYPQLTKEQMGKISGYELTKEQMKGITGGWYCYGAWSPCGTYGCAEMEVYLGSTYEHCSTCCIA